MKLALVVALSVSSIVVFSSIAGEPDSVAVRHYVGDNPIDWTITHVARSEINPVSAAFAAANARAITPHRLAYSSFFGGSGLERATSGDLEVDDAGNFYVSAESRSVDLPGAPNALAADGTIDFLAKFDPLGQLVWITTYGGDGSDKTWDMAVDRDGNIYLVGSTGSVNFPTSSAFQGTYLGVGDAFIMKFDATGALVWSTFLGGDATDHAIAVDIDADGRPVLVGWTSSEPSNGDQTRRDQGAFPTSDAGRIGSGGRNEIFVMNFNPDGSGFSRSFFVGGDANEDPERFEIAPDGRYIILGAIDEQGTGTFPVANSFQSTYGGGDYDVFLMKVIPDGSGLVYSTYLGGSLADQARALAVTQSGTAVVTGTTSSTDFPTFEPLVGTLEQATGGTLSAFGPDGSVIFAGYAPFVAIDMAAGLADEVFITGTGSAANVPMVDPLPGGDAASGGYAFATVFDVPTRAITFSSLYPGRNTFGHHIAVNASSDIYLMGPSLSGDIPIVDAYQSERGGGQDLFIARIVSDGVVALEPGISVDPNPVQFPLTLPGQTSAETVTITSTGTAPLEIQNIDVEPTDLFDLPGEPATPLTLQPGEEVSFDVVYRPPSLAKELSAQADAGTLTIVNNTSTQILAVPLKTSGIIVNHEGDEADLQPDDGVCDVDVGMTGRQCTLRAAIQTVNGLKSNEVIQVGFALPDNGPHVINIDVKNQLPHLTYPAQLDATTQPGSGQVIIRGNRDASNIEDLSTGLPLEAAGSIVRGFLVEGFRLGFGLVFSDITVEACEARNNVAGISLGGTSHEVRDCTLYGNGVGINLVNAHDATIDGNTIGRTSEKQNVGVVLDGGGENTLRANVIISNFISGVRLKQTSGNKIQDNLIGTNELGDLELGNAVGIELSLSSDNLIQNNTISANRLSGVSLNSGADNRVEDNKIGVDRTGTRPLGNGAEGVDVSHSNRTILRNNIVSNNGGSGIIVRRSSQGIQILDSKIGTGARGELQMPNAQHGIEILGGWGDESHAQMENHRIVGNVISANILTGVRVANGASQTSILDNRIGVDESGTVPLGNGENGIELENAGVTVIRGNTISGNAGDGVMISGRSPTQHEISVNRIGTDWHGLRPIGNGRNGIFLDAAGTWIFHNLISANQANGILSVSGVLPGIHLVIGNYIGSDNRRRDIRGDMGNRRSGILLDGSGNVDIQENFIAFNNEDGVFLNMSNDVGVHGNEIRRNVVGVRVRGEGASIVSDNRIHLNVRNIDATDVDRELVIENNDVFDGTGAGTGIHLTASNAVIRGNNFSNDAGDAITAEEGSRVNVTNNNLINNGGFGVNNLDASIVIRARENWWGDASGPRGSGPGIGDAVSTSIDFADWHTEPVGITLSASPDTLDIPPGANDTTAVYVQNWMDRDDIIQISVFDTKEWLSSPNAFEVELVDSMSARANLSFAIPVTAVEGAESVATILATSRSDGSNAADFRVVIKAQLPGLSGLFVGPDSVEAMPGDTTYFFAQGFDQFGREFETAVQWSSTGGSIDNSGVFVAGSEIGTFQVTATDGSGTHSASGIVTIVQSTVDTEEPDPLPTTYTLHQNYPNPFNASTTLWYELPVASSVRLSVFDALGRRIRLLVSADLGPGRHSVVWNGTNDSGVPISSGLYFYRLQSSNFVKTRMMVLIR